MVHPAHEHEPPSPTAPGVGGYALAILVSLLALAIELGVRDALLQGSMHDLAVLVFVVILFGAVPAAVIGSIGALVVHFVTRGASSQWPAVTLASAVGLVAGLIVWGGKLRIRDPVGSCRGSGSPGGHFVRSTPREVTPLDRYVAERPGP